VIAIVSIPVIASAAVTPTVKFRTRMPSLLSRYDARRS
jgi:hypothetical protein